MLQTYNISTKTTNFVRKLTNKLTNKKLVADKLLF